VESFLFSIIGVLIGVGVVYATGGAQPNIMGHTGGELNVSFRGGDMNVNDALASIDVVEGGVVLNECYLTDWDVYCNPARFAQARSISCGTNEVVAGFEARWVNTDYGGHGCTYPALASQTTMPELHVSRRYNCCNLSLG